MGRGSSYGPRRSRNSSGVIGDAGHVAVPKRGQTAPGLSLREHDGRDPLTLRGIRNRGGKELVKPIGLHTPVVDAGNDRDCGRQLLGDALRRMESRPYELVPRAQQQDPAIHLNSPATVASLSRLILKREERDITGWSCEERRYCIIGTDEQPQGVGQHITFHNLPLRGTRCTSKGDLSLDTAIVGEHYHPRPPWMLLRRRACRGSRRRGSAP